MDKLSKVDLHNHSFYSLLRIPRLRSDHFFQDSALSPKMLIKVAKKRKLDAVALTDHDNMNGIRSFKYYARKYSNIVPITGQEVTKYDQDGKVWAHVLCYGLEKIPWKIRFKPLNEFLEFLDEENAVYILAHPFDLSQTAPAGGYNKDTYEINFSILKRFGMVETINGLQPKRHNHLCQIIARELKIPGTAGSDSHQPKMVGRCYTMLEGSNEEEILESLRKIKKNPAKNPIHIVGTGSDIKIWSDWFYFIGNRLDFNLRYDLYQKYHPNSPIKPDPVYNYIYRNVPMFSKILFRAAIPYIFPVMTGLLKIYNNKVYQNIKKKEVKILKSLVDYQAYSEANNHKNIIFKNISTEELVQY